MHNLSQSDFLSLKLYENLQLKSVPKYLDEAFLTDLYVNKGQSLRHISNKLDCSRKVVRNQLSSKGIFIEKIQRTSVSGKFLNRIQKMRSEGMSYQKIAQRLNENKTRTRSKKGKWHASSVKNILRKE